MLQNLRDLHFIFLSKVSSSKSAWCVDQFLTLAVFARYLIQQWRKMCLQFWTTQFFGESTQIQLMKCWTYTLTSLVTRTLLNFFSCYFASSVDPHSIHFPILTSTVWNWQILCLHFSCYLCWFSSHRNYRRWYSYRCYLREAFVWFHLKCYQLCWGNLFL